MSNFAPRLFIPAGEVEWAQLLSAPPRFISEGRDKSVRSSSFTRQQREGLRYERRAIEYLRELNEKHAERGFAFFPSPWIMFKSKGSSSSQARFCQPDTFLLNEAEGKIILFEIKLQHTNTAWRQIRLLYEPVLRVIYPSFEIASIELCKWLDPHTSFGGEYHFAEDIYSAGAEKLGVHLFKPGRERKKGRTKGKTRTSKQARVQ